MNTPRSLRSFLVRSLLAAVLSSTPVFAISKEELAALRTKAENGNGIAQYNLGLVYATVSDPIADPVEAYVWFNLAADNGATGRALVLLSSHLTNEQVAEAKQRLDARRAELEAKRKSLSAGSPVSAPETSPISGTSSPIVAAPSMPDPPISAGPVSDREFTSLQAELKKISNELSTAWKENEQLRATIAKGNQGAAATGQLQRELDQLRATSASTNEELTKLRATAASSESERAALLQKIATAGQAQKDGAGAELAAATSKLRAAEAQLAQATTVNEELANAKQTIANLSEQVRKTSAENQRLTVLAAQTGSLAESNATAEKELSALRSELSNARSQMTAAKTEIDAGGVARKRVEDTEIKLEAALRSHDLQKKDVERLQKALANIDGEREGLAQQLAALKAAPTKADTASEQRIVKLTADLEAARASGRQVAQLQKLLSDNQAKLKSAEDTLASANQEKERLEQQLAAAKAAPVVPSGELTRLNLELTDTRGRLSAAEQALARSKDERDRATQEAARTAQNQVAQLTSESQQLRQKLSASDDSLSKVEKERASLHQQLTAATASAGNAAELATVQTRLRTAEAALATSQAERVALAERLNTAESKANTLASITTARQPLPGEDPTELRKELTETQSKLNAALRTYQLQQDDVDRLQKSLAAIQTERAELVDRVHAMDTQATQAQAQGAANQDAAGQLAAAREQFRQAQNQIASLAGENSQLKNRLANAGPSSTAQPIAVTATAGPTSPNRVVSPVPTQTAAASRPAPTAPTRPAAPPATRTHTVADGDTLTKIARRYYGSSDRWPQILEANRSVIKDVNNLTLGSSLRIP